MGLFNRVFLGHKIDEWASEWTLIASRTLNQVAADLIVLAEDEIGKVGLKDGLFNPAAFVHARVAPMVRAAAEPIANSIVDEANAALLELVDVQADWMRGPAHAEGADRAFEGAKDVAAAAVPLAAGVASVAALPFAAVTTTTAWFGLVTTTAISWPIVVGGGALAGLGLATGALNTAKLRDRTQIRLRERVRQFVVSSLIAGCERSPAILQQLGVPYHPGQRQAWL